MVKCTASNPDFNGLNMHGWINPSILLFPLQIHFEAQILFIPFMNKCAIFINSYEMLIFIHCGDSLSICVYIYPKEQLLISHRQKFQIRLNRCNVDFRVLAFLSLFKVQHILLLNIRLLMPVESHREEPGANIKKELITQKHVLSPGNRKRVRKNLRPAQS